MTHQTLVKLCWLNQTIKVNIPHSILKHPPPQAVIITDAALEAWGATLQLVKDDKFFNPKK
jgi:hypothetical protein